LNDLVFHRRLIRHGGAGQAYGGRLVKATGGRLSSRFDHERDGLDVVKPGQMAKAL
jgi:hypothetical protein